MRVPAFINDACCGKTRSDFSSISIARNPYALKRRAVKIPLKLPPTTAIFLFAVWQGSSVMDLLKPVYITSHMLPNSVLPRRFGTIRYISHSSEEFGAGRQVGRR